VITKGEMSILVFCLSGVGQIILSVIGVISIVLSIIVFIRIQTPFAYSLIALAIFDFFFLISAFISYSLPVFIPELLEGSWMEYIEMWNDFSKCGILVRAGLFLHSWH